MTVTELHHFVLCGTPEMRTWGMIAPPSVNANEAITWSHLLLSRKWSHQKTKYVIGAEVHKQERRHMGPKSVVQVVLGRMQFTLHATRRTPHGVSRLVQAMSAWLVKTRRFPCRHSREVRVYGHMTTAMHKLSTLSHLPSSSKPFMYIK